MAELTDEAKQQIELEVHRLLEQGDMKRQNQTIDQLSLYRDFLVKNTRWVVGGFFGLLIVFGALATFIFGSQLDHRYLDAIISEQISENLQRKIATIADLESSKAIATIQSAAILEEERATEKIGKVVADQTQDILTDEVTSQIESVKKSFAELDPLEIVDSILVEGAVMAFDRPEGCPANWVEFTEANGRFILGVDGSKYMLPYVGGKPLYQTGGEESHTLSPNEIPGHTHSIVIPPHQHQHTYGTAQGAGSNTGRGLHGAPYYFPNESLIPGPPSGTQVAVSDKQPGDTDKSHNNMPPYVALYFCKYEGTG